MVEAGQGLTMLSIARTGSVVSEDINFNAEQDKTLQTPVKGNYITRFVKSRSFHCVHHRSCFENTLAGFKKNFKLGLLAKFVLTAIPFLIKLNFKKLLKILISADYIKDCFKLALFGGLMCSTYKGVLCLVRRFID